MDLQALCELTVVQLIEEHNRLAKSLELEPLKKWDGEKQELASRILEMREAERKRGSARTIKSAAYEWLVKVDFTDHASRSVGFSYDRILAELRAEFPDAGTTDKCLRWYAVQFNLDGAKMPSYRPRRAPKRKKPEEPKQVQAIQDDEDGRPM